MTALIATILTFLYVALLAAGHYNVIRTEYGRVKILFFGWYVIITNSKKRKAVTSRKFGRYSIRVNKVVR